MITDKLENIKLYLTINPRFSKALEYLQNTNLKEIENGKYKIENDEIFAIVQEYMTKDKNECKLEGHKNYIDIQYIISGEELIGISTLENQEKVTVNKEDDYTFYEGESYFIKLKEGMFAIFFPDDLHMPSIKVEATKSVKKIVIKVKI